MAFSVVKTNMMLRYQKVASALACPYYRPSLLPNRSTDSTITTVVYHEKSENRSGHMSVCQARYQFGIIRSKKISTHMSVCLSACRLLFVQSQFNKDDRTNLVMLCRCLKWIRSNLATVEEHDAAIMVPVPTPNKPQCTE
jgi:hypothetical protein